jgi:hypothetical protein
MKKTKEKILDTALRLFNQEGLANIKLRRIATEMGISQGTSTIISRKERILWKRFIFNYWS